MSNEQNRGTPILNLDDLGGVQQAGALDLKFDPSSDLGAVTGAGAKDQQQPDNAAPGSSASPDSFDSDSVIAAPLLHPASEEISKVSSESHTLVDGSASGHADSFVMPVVSNEGSTQAGDLFSAFAVVHNVTGGATSDFSTSPSGSLLGIDNPLHAHLDGASSHIASHPVSGPVTEGGGGGDPTGELWIAESTNNEGVLQHINSDQTNLATTYTQTTVAPAYASDGAPLGLAMTGLDTADNLYFTFGADDAMTVGNISTGTVLNVTQLASYTDDDSVEAMAVDPFNHTIYLSLLGADYTSDGGDIIKITYNPSTGALTTPYDPSANSGNGSTTIAASGILIDSTTTSGVYGLANGMWLSPDGSELYYSDDDGGNGGGFEPSATNGIYEVATSGTNPQPVLLTTNATQFPTNGSNGWIVGVAVDPAKDLIYFTTDDRTGGGTSEDALWYIPISGGTAIKVGGVTLDQPQDQDSLVIDENAQTLYVYDDGTDKVVKVVLSANGESAASVNSSFVSFTGSTDAGLNYDSLPVLGVSSTATHAMQGGGAVNLVSSAPTITLESADLMAKATVVIANFQTGDVLSAASEDGITSSWNASTHTLTLTGVTTAANYETVLDTVTYQDGGTDTTTTGAHPVRTFDWAINDGITLSGATLSDPDQGSTTITIDRDPSVATGGTATFDGGGSAVALDAAATATDLDGSNLTGATVTIASGYTTGDTLNFTNQNGISGSWNASTHVLTLTGSASAANYQTALDSISYGFSPSNGDPTNGGSDTSRSIHWQVTSSVGNSNTGTSTLDTVHVAPTVTASGSVTYNVGGAAVTLDSGLTATAPDSSGNLTSATVSVSGGSFSVDGDTLSATTAGTSIIASYNSSNETLTLSGADTLAHYESVLDSVMFSSTGATGGSRTIDWTVNDGVDNSSTGTSSVTLTVPAPTVGTSGTVTFNGGGSAVVLDSSATVTNPAGGNMTGATVTIASGDTSGDTLNFTNQNGITGSYNSGTGVLTLSGSASTANYQTALDSITYSFSPSNGDPTAGGGDASRTIHWVVTSALGGNSTTGTSTLDTVHVAPTVTASGTVSYTAGGPSAVLDSGLTLSDPDSGGNLTGATIFFGEGITVAGDTLNFTNQNGITGSYNSGTGTLTLSGSASIANYQAALESITYTFTPTSGDPTAGGSDPSRTIQWQVTDGVGNSNSGTSTLDVAADVAPAVSSLTGSATSGANFAGGYTATFTLDVSKDVTVAGGTTLSLSDGGTATYVSGSGTTTLTFTYDATDAPQALTVTGISAGSIEDGAGKSLPIAGTSISPYSDAVTDSAANVAANFVSLDSAVSFISSITLNDGGTPNLDLTASEIVNDQTLIGKIVSSYNLIANDTASAIGSNFDSLETFVSSISAVIFTDGGAPTLDLTQTQVTSDASLLAKVQGPFDLLVSGVTGQAYTSYQNNYNASDTLTQTTDFNTDGTETIFGYVKDLSLTGSANNDTFRLQKAPAVTANGGAGNDTFFFGSGFSKFDHIDGGTGNNTIELDGTYTGANALVMTGTTMVNIEDMHLAKGHSYDITLAAGNLTAGQTLIVQGAALGAGDSLTFNGSAVTSAGNLTIDAGKGTDILTGGAGINTFNMGDFLTASDQINGGTGTSSVHLDGNYGGGVAFTATTMTNVSTLDLAAGNSYNLAMNAATVASGHTLTVDGSTLSSDSFFFNGSAVTDGGNFIIHGGAGSNELTGGSGNDVIYTGTGTSYITGGGGADTIIAGNNFDTFGYNAVSDSTSTTRDTISGFNTSTDKIALLNGLTAPTVINTAVTTGHLSTATFDANLALDIGAAQLSAHGAVLFTASTGGLAGQTFLIIDENGVAGYQAGQDIVIHLTNGMNLSSLDTFNFETSVVF